jgi:hypothetical protein
MILEHRHIGGVARMGIVFSTGFFPSVWSPEPPSKNNKYQISANESIK